MLKAYSQKEVKLDQVRKVKKIRKKHTIQSLHSMDIPNKKNTWAYKC